MKPILNYRSPEKIAAKGPSRSYLANVAGILAAFFTVALIFVGFCDLVFGAHDTPLLILPELIAAIGYYMRAFGRFSLNWRRAIWFVSFLVQGGYGIFILWATAQLLIPAVAAAISLLSLFCMTAEGTDGKR